MPRYVIQCKIEGLYGSAEPGEYSDSFSTIGKATMRSGVLEFPNEIREGQKIVLRRKEEEISDVVVSVEHVFLEQFSVLHLEDKKVKNSESREKALEAFEELKRKYSLIQKLLF